MSDNSVAALAVLCIFGAPVAGYIVVRVLAHRERIEMIRRGMMPPQMSGKGRSWGDFRGLRDRIDAPNRADYVPPTWAPDPRESVYGAPHWVMPDPTECASRSLRKGIMMALIGLAIVIGLSFNSYDLDGPLHTLEFHPGPLLLGGLIPMFVGIAQIIVALLSGARLGPPTLRPISPPYPGAAGGPQPSEPAPYAPGPEPRTHSGYDELRRPSQPPDRR